MVVENLLQGQGAVSLAGSAVGAAAEDETPGLIQNAGQLQVGQHPVDPVDLFVDVFDEEDRILP